MLYGHQPRHFGISNLSAASVPELEEWLKERDLLTQIIQQHLARAQQRMKSQADKDHTEREFTVGTSVYLKLQPYIQTSVAPRSNQKLAFRFFGPFKILQRVGKVAYMLDLLDSCRIHPVVHVSQLKLHVPPHEQVPSDLSSLPANPSQVMVPLAILDHRLVSLGSSSRPRVLMQWSDIHPQLTTWEDAQDIARRFPGPLACGQAEI